LFENIIVVQLKIKAIMKTSKHQILTVTARLILAMPLLLLAIAVSSSCASKKKTKTIQTEIAPPPPPPPSPRKSDPKEKVKIVAEESEDVSDEIPFVVVEEMPMFPGGDSTLLAYIVQNTKYPESAKINKTEGRVIVRFCVNSKGLVDRVTILRGVNPDLDAESVRVVSSLPAFIPGRQGGKPVPVWYMVPVTFALK
jgi:periplasmic protein TonB